MSVAINTCYGGKYTCCIADGNSRCGPGPKCTTQYFGGKYKAGNKLATSDYLKS